MKEKRRKRRKGPQLKQGRGATEQMETEMLPAVVVSFFWGGGINKRNQGNQIKEFLTWVRWHESFFTAFDPELVFIFV